MIYLDNSATTKPYSEVLDSFQQVTMKFFGNPSSINKLGMEAERLLLKSREQAARLMGVFSDEVVFTSGGTEGNNTAIKGIALEHQTRGKHIITTQVEHPSVIEACKGLEALGFHVTYLPVDSYGVVSVEDVNNAITDETILISVMHVNNELGSIQPIKEIGSVAKRYPKLFFHVDNVQGFGKVPLELKEYGIDLCTISGHKIHGLNGTGILYIKRNTLLFPLLHGGGQESGYRSGTENLAGVVAMVKAMRLIVDKQKEEGNRLKKMQMKLRNGLKSIQEVNINSPEENVAPHIVNFSVPGYKPEVVIHSLAKKGIHISTKSACSSKHSDESAVLVACGLNKQQAISALRVSLSYDTEEDDITASCGAIQDVLEQLSEVMGR